MNKIDWDLTRGTFYEFIDHGFNELNGNLLFIQAALRKNANESAFEFSDVGVDRVGDVFNNILFNLNTIVVKLLAQNSNARLKTWFLKIGT